MSAPTPRETARRARRDAFHWAGVARTLLVLFGVLLMIESVIDGYDWRVLLGGIMLGLAIGDIR
jgi:hypothetical protein